MQKQGENSKAEGQRVREAHQRPIGHDDIEPQGHVAETQAYWRGTRPRRPLEVQSRVR